ncbi:Hypothetical protein, putative [Bodo saltans]|uniref:Uncharacterized protein n=1 Tax=Bodo saltans TaxID=75058 RepID=A0A0S4JNT2_BODSA|nr:Hypothetical protein, putative [Bodo saltans]|eukprot:CUG91570.1 Hypothetical protein, putative [Bodo saltans]
MDAVRDKLKQNVTALRHNVAKSLNNGVPAEYRIPQAPIRNALSTAVKAATQTTPQPVFEGFHQQLDETEEAIHNVLEQLEGTRRDSVRAVTSMRNVVSPSSALLVDADCIERPTPATSSAASTHTDASPPVSTSYHLLESNVARLMAANDDLTVALAQLCRIGERKPPLSSASENKVAA